MRKQYDRFKYCKIQTECLEIDPRHMEDIGIDLRSLPVDSEVDRVCCKCGESLSADGKCDYCDQTVEKEWRYGIQIYHAGS